MAFALCWSHAASESNPFPLLVTRAIIPRYKSDYVTLPLECDTEMAVDLDLGEGKFAV